MKNNVEGVAAAETNVVLSDVPLEQHLGKKKTASKFYIDIQIFTNKHCIGCHILQYEKGCACKLGFDITNDDKLFIILTASRGWKIETIDQQHRLLQHHIMVVILSNLNTRINEFNITNTTTRNHGKNHNGKWFLQSTNIQLSGINELDDEGEYMKQF